MIVVPNPLQFLQSLSISVGMAFATSCFTMVSGIVNAAGILVLPAIATSTLIALVVAHAIGRLAKRFPSSLGIRTYIKSAFGNTTSLFFVFLYLLMICLISGVEANMYATIVQYVIPSLETRLIILGIFMVVIAMNVFGYEFSKNVQVAMVVLMLSGVLSLSLFGIGHGGLSSVVEQQITSQQLVSSPAAIISAFFLFVGFEWVTSVQPSSRGAAAQLPWVLLASITLLGCVYLTFSLAAVVNFSHSEWMSTDKPQMLLAKKLWGEAGVSIMLVVSTCAVLTAFNAGVLGAARLLYGLAREGVLPRLFSTTARFSGAPVSAIAATTAVSLCSALLAYALQETYFLGSLAAIIICICYCGLLGASLVLHRRNTDRLKVRFSLAQVIEFCALLLMVALLATLVSQDYGLRHTGIVLGTVATLLLLAILANRHVNPKTFTSAPWHHQSPSFNPNDERCPTTKGK